MSVIEFHIWPEDNPVGEGNKLGVITDEDVVTGEGGPAIWYEPALHGLNGTAGFSISRHSPLATTTIIREDNFVRVKVPEIGAGYLKFGWWMKSGQFHLIDSDEAGGENITIEGPGLLHKLATGSLYHSSTVSDQPARGSANRDGIWWWTNEPYGAVLTRAMEEGRHSPYPDAAEVGSPLEFFDITFSRTVDSDSVAWPSFEPASYILDFSAAFGTILTVSPNGFTVGQKVVFDSIVGGTGLTAGQAYWVGDVASSTSFRVSETDGGDLVDVSTDITGGAVHAVTSSEFQLDIGTDLMTAMDRLRESGNLYIVGDASDVDTLTVHCYQTYGDDLSGDFDTDTVRFERAVNIATELVRTSEAALRINKLLLRNSDGDYSTETLPGFSAGDVERWGFWDANQTNDDTLLNAIGLNVLLASQTSVEPVGFEALPGKEPTEGLYLPELHYKCGDTVTVHTGTDAEDYNEANQLVVAYRVSIREGSTDDTNVRAQRSLKIEPQLNYYSPRYGNSNIGTGPMQGPGCRCLRLCEPGTVSDPTIMFRYTSLDGAMTANPSPDAAWEINVDSPNPPKALPATPGDTRDGAINTTNSRDPADDIFMTRFAIELDSESAPIIAAGGATILMHARARTRAGIGISESSQHMISQMGAYVTAGDSTTKRGTALALHDLADSTGSAEWNKSSTPRNMEWPAAAANNVLSAVAATVSGDFLVMEVGVRNFTVDGEDTGSHIWFNDRPTAAGDLPNDLTTTANLRSWIQITHAGVGTAHDGHPDLVGTDKDVARCDHRHDVHRDRAPTASDDESLGYKLGTIWAQLDDLDAPTVMVGVWMLVDATAGAAVWLSIGTSSDTGHSHHASEITYDPTDSGLAGDTVQEAIDELSDTIGEGVFLEKSDGENHTVNVVAATGSTETIDLSSGNYQDFTLDDDCTFTMPAVGAGKTFTAFVRQDGTGGWTPTFTAVEWPDDTPPEWSTDPDTVDIVEFISDASVWYGFAGVTDPSSANRVTLNFIIDGGGAAITTGIKGDVVVDFNCTIESVTMLSDTSTTTVVDIWKDTYANFPPVDGDSITASAVPTITAATKSQNTTLTGWTTSITAGQTLRFNVDSNNNSTRLTVALKLLRT